MFLPEKSSKKGSESVSDSDILFLTAQSGFALFKALFD